MYGIVGFTNFSGNMKNQEALAVLKNMNNTLNRRGSDKGEDYFNDEAYFACTGRINTGKDGNKAKGPIACKYFGNTYAITYNGQIYNAKEIKEKLEENGFAFETNSDAEVLLKAYIYYGNNVVHYLNGVFAFAIWNECKKELFMARDHFGVKPFFYSIKDNEIIFASEIKALFEYPSIYPKIDETGIAELFGIGPAHTPGIGVFSGIEELKPAEYMAFSRSGIRKERYWKLKSKKHTDDLQTTCKTVKSLLIDSIERQCVSEEPVCTFLSGGLDSSIITLVAANHCRKNGLPLIDTYSVDYVDNDKNFKKTDFQPNADEEYINLMTNKLGTRHHKIVLDTPELAEKLEAAMIARDLPGMADVDSSLLLFCEKVKPNASIAITGECADEMFGGYPWFFREDTLNSGTFPWSINIKQRQHLLNPEIENKINLKEYIDYRYNESLKEVELLDTDTFATKEKRKITHLTINWFMQTLLIRAERMGMYNGFELRVPFCDYRLAEYVWNIPWEMKALNGREKGLLRHIMKDELPKEIGERKKSPYPKTWNPTYLAKVKEMLTKITEDENAPINYLLNREDILEILNTDGKSFTRPWFGQLMTGPQLMAYLCQVNMWLERYKPEIDL